MPTNPGRWDRTLTKHVSRKPGRRVEVEKRLADGESGNSIAKSLGFPKSTWVSACKKNPLPGGVLDPKGKQAEYDGDWIDEGGLIRPWKGLNEKGKPKLFTFPEKAKGRGPGIAKGGTNAVGILSAYFARPSTESEAKGKVVTFAPRVDSPSNPRAGHLAPDAKHAGSDDTPMLDEPIEEYDKVHGHSGKRSAATIAKLARKALSIEQRIALLAEIAEDTSEPGTALRAIQTLNELDGTSRKAEEGMNRGNAPLFALPKGTRMNFAPVGSAEPTTREIEQEDALLHENPQVEDDPTETPA